MMSLTKNKLIVAATLFILTTPLQAVVIKLGAIAPDGTNWAKSLKEFSKEVRKLTQNKVKFKIYYGGVAGDEPDVLRKIRVGQMHGGVFTGKTLGDIVSDVRALEIPFNFYHDREKGFKAMKEMSSTFNEEFKSAGFVNLGFYEIGQVYVVTTKKVSNIGELQGIKIWSWEGDKVVEAMLNSLKLVSVPLALPDVLSSLSTNMIDAAYAPPLGILGLQWQSQVKYLIDFPTAYSIGALLIGNKQWEKISPEHREVVSKLAKKYVDQANEDSVKDNKLGLKMLQEQGIEFIKFSQSDIDKAESIREQVLAKLKGKVLSEGAIKKINQFR